MFKRLFFFSGIVAFLLACLTMWLWYLPNHPTTYDEMNQTVSDTVSIQDTVNLN